MSNSVKAWRPSQATPHYLSLTVPYSGSQPMNQSLYETVLWRGLGELISQNPKRAKELLTDSPDYSPALYEIGMSGDPKDWPSQILACDQTQKFLGRLNWSAGTSLSLSPSELPNLDAVLESLPL